MSTGGGDEGSAARYDARILPLVRTMLRTRPKAVNRKPRIRAYLGFFGHFRRPVRDYTEMSGSWSRASRTR